MLRSELARLFTKQSKTGVLKNIETMRTLLALFVAGGLALGFAPGAHAAAYDWLFELKDQFDSQFTQAVAPIQDSQYHLLAKNPVAYDPMWLGIGGGLFVDGNTLKVDTIPMSSVTSLDSTITTINSNIAGKANTSHFHSVGQISSFYEGVENGIASSTQVVKVQRIATTTDTSGVYTWTFPQAFATGTVPVVTGMTVDSTSGAMSNVQITSISNTQVTVQARRLSTILGILTLTTNPQVTVHLTAVKA